jgi:ABC-2 type transport system ATP-binding protein
MNLIEVRNAGFSVKDKLILRDVSFSAGAGMWIGILGENGSGKTTLIDLLMGFKAPSTGAISMLGMSPADDLAALRQSVAYLSEKVDLPGDCTIGDFLRLNAFFYPTYDRSLESTLCQQLKVDARQRIGNLSAGQIRRAQIVAALSYRPQLILIDEITAVLDIVGRRQLMRILRERVDQGALVIFATNILEGLQGNLTDLLLMKNGTLIQDASIQRSLLDGSETKFYETVSSRLEAA